MSRERWSEVATLFEAATSLPPEQRSAYLDQVSGGDPELRAQVEALIAADAVASGTLDRVIGRAAGELASSLEPVGSYEGRRIGAYEVVRELGRGGMGAVLLAVRADDAYRKTVAIKIVRGGAEDADLVRRFVAERQILANLEHPYIARLLDGGTTTEGLPFVVMEHVVGEPLDVYCDNRRLPVRARLELFLRICAAVQHAHANLVVHRDLKPSNILVGADGTPKLLDFGIAKLLDGPSYASAPRTAARWMTVEYASPEQIRNEAITTASDVYSLGVVLYELLAGGRPFDGARDARTLELAMTTRQPNAPSVAASRADDAVWRARAASRDRLRRALAGDLDTMVLMGLRQEPARRYQSVEQFAEDVRRHLSGQPVIARRDTVTYRIGKFVGRNRTKVVAAALLAAVIGFYTVRLSHERDRAQLEAARSEQVAAFLQDLFKASAPGQSQGADVTARELVTRGAARIEQALAGQPELRSTMLGVIGGVYSGLGLYDTAATVLHRALVLHREHAISDDPGSAGLLTALAGARLNAGDFDSPDSLFRQALQIRRQALGADDPLVTSSIENLAFYLRRRDQLDEAASLYDEALAIERRAQRTGQLASLLDGLGEVRNRQGNYLGAEQLFREAVQLVERAEPLDPLILATARNNLAVALSELGKNDEAAAHIRYALTVYQRHYEPDHAFVSSARVALGRIMRDVGSLATAESLFVLALEADRRRLGPEHAAIATQLGYVAGIRMSRGRAAEAEQLYREALAIRVNAYGAEHAFVAVSINELAGALRAKGDLEAAERRYREALALRRRVHEPGHPYIAYSLVGLGEVLAERGRTSDAEPLIREALSIRDAVLPATHYLAGYTRAVLGDVLGRMTRYAESDSLLDAGLRIMRAARPGEDGERTRLEERLREVRTARGG